MPNSEESMFGQSVKLLEETVAAVARGRIENSGIIWFDYPVTPHDVAELVDAINYLVDEWDFQSKGFTIGPPVFLNEITKEIK